VLHTQAKTLKVETMEINVNSTSPYTLAPPEQRPVGDLAVVPDGNVVKGSTGLGAELSSPQQNAAISLIDSHKSNPTSTATLVMLSSNSFQVFVSLAPVNGWKSS
jgi:hypothetical protein